MTTRRLLHLIDTGGPGGAETVLAELVTHLPAERWISRVIVPMRDWLHARLEESHVDTRVVPSQGTGDLRYLGTLVRTLREFRPALIHAHLLGAGTYGSIAAAISSGVPVVCTLHGMPDIREGDRLLGLKARILSRSLNRIVYVSDDLRRQMEPRLGIPRHLGVRIHNGVAFPDPSSPLKVRREVGAGEDEVLVGAVGNIRPAKDYPNLVRAAAIVCRAQPNVRFIVAGQGHEDAIEELRALARDHGVDGRMTFLGYRRDVGDILSALDIFVSSSSSEGLPLATLEAMGLGVGVVLTDCGGPAEVVRPDVTGILVAPRDPDALANGILALARDRDQSREMGAAAAHDVRGRFALERMVDEYETLYESLIDAHAGVI